MTSFQSRVLVTVLGVPLLVWMILFAPLLVLKLAVVVLSAIAATELMNCIGVDKKHYLCLCSIGCGALTCLFPEGIALWWLLTIMLLFLCAILKAGEVKFYQLAAAVFAGMLIPYSFSAFLRIEVMGYHRAYLLLPFILSFACDTFAYLVGCTIGKHKLAPKVSPKKSVEGSIGGLVGNVLCGLLFAFVMTQNFGGGVGYGAMTVLALLCGAVAQIGDLSFSLIKREFGVKDYGKLFLAHGGVLDRFDSVLFVTPVMELILQWVN